MLSKLRLLIIEDDPTSAKLMQITLARLGYEVAGIASNGIDAIDMVRQANPDLLLMDINLPGQIDGIQTIEKIKGENDIPVIYVTANTEDSTIQHAIRTNPIGYLVKPFNREHLKTMVEMGIHKHKLEQEIRQSKELLTVTIDNIGDGVFLVNNEGTIVLSNSAAQLILKTPEQLLTGKNLIEVFPLLKNETKEGLDAAVWKNNNDGKHSISDIKWSDQNGNQLILEIQIVRIKGIRSDNATMVITFRDVTARRQEADRLVKLKEELEFRVESRTVELRKKNLELEHEVMTRLEAQKELQEALEKEKDLNLFQANIVTTVSHEFRTPLTTIQSSAELIERSMQKEIQPESIKRHLKQINKSVSALSNLINDVLLVEKMSASKHDTMKEDIDPEGFFNNLVLESKIGIGRRHNLEYQHNIFPSVLISDPRLLTYIVTNLLSNAFKYSEPGTTVMLVIHYSQAMLKIIVKDDGIGISENAQQLLFNTFYRDQEVVNIEGTGVGLTIVKESVELLKGTINIKSEKGHGSTFTVSIPLGTEL